MLVHKVAPIKRETRRAFEVRFTSKRVYNCAAMRVVDQEGRSSGSPSMNKPQVEPAEAMAPPLCTSYVCLAFRVSEQGLRAESNLRSSHMCWAVGILSSGEPHYVGSWARSEPAAFCWSCVGSELRDRGVKRLRLVLSPDPSPMEAAIAPLYPGVTVLPVVGRALDRTALAVLHPEHRRYVEHAHGLMHFLDARLKRAVARRPGFSLVATRVGWLRRWVERQLAEGGSSLDMPRSHAAGSAPH